MPILIFFMLLFAALGLIWVLAAGLLVGTFVSQVPRALEHALDYKGGYCACHFPFRRHQ